MRTRERGISKPIPTQTIDYSILHKNSKLQRNEWKKTKTLSDIDFNYRNASV
jgi:hypothetical protein